MNACRAVVACGVLLAAALSGCASGPNQGGLGGLPSLGEVRSRVTPIEPPNNPDLQTQYRVEAMIRVVALPLDQRLNEVWDHVDRDVLPGVTQRVWRENGLRVGVVGGQALSQMVKAMPQPVAQEYTRMIGSERRQPIHTGPKLTAPVTLNTAMPNEPARRVRLRGGRARLLARMRPRPDRPGSVILSLTPHHYEPRLSVKPRPATEQALDGRIFDDLSVRFAVPTGHFAVIGLHRPSASPLKNHDAAGGEAQRESGNDMANGAATQPDEANDKTDKTDEPRQASGAPRFGEGLLTRRHAGGPVQELLLVSFTRSRSAGR